MYTSQLHDQLLSYQTRLKYIEDSLPKPSSAHILELLTARDGIQLILASDIPHSSQDLTQLFQLDKRLKGLAEPITTQVNLPVWRQSFTPVVKGWWWELEQFVHQKQHPWDRFDSLWHILTLIALAAASGLAIEISSRFLRNGPDLLGAITVIIQSGLTLLTARSVISDLGTKEFNNFLRKQRIPPHFWAEIKLGTATALLLLLFIFHLSLPAVAQAYYNSGMTQQTSGDLMRAEASFQRATLLNPTFADAHLQLGTVAEKLSDDPQAEASYQLAISNGSLSAYNELATLKLNNGETTAAAHLLTERLTQPSIEKEEQYTLLTNLALARIAQERVAEAITHLETAVNLFPNQPTAYCLLGRSYIELGNTKRAEIYWEKCSSASSSTTEQISEATHFLTDE